MRSPSSTLPLHTQKQCSARGSSWGSSILISDHRRLPDPPWGRVAKPLISPLTPVPLHAMFQKWCAWFHEAGCQPGVCVSRSWLNRCTVVCHRVAECQCQCQCWRSKCWCTGIPGRACQHANKIVAIANFCCCLSSVITEGQRPIQSGPYVNRIWIMSDLLTTKWDIQILMCFDIV